MALNIYWILFFWLWTRFVCDLYFRSVSPLLFLRNEINEFHLLSEIKTEMKMVVNGIPSIVLYLDRSTFWVVAKPNKQLGVSTWLYRLYVWFGVDFTFSTFLESIQSKLSIWESVLFRSSQFLQHGPLINRLSLFRTQLLSAHFALAMVFICLVIMDSNDYGWCVSDWVSISLSLSRSVPVYVSICAVLCVFVGICCAANHDSST